MPMLVDSESIKLSGHHPSWTALHGRCDASSATVYDTDDEGYSKVRDRTEPRIASAFIRRIGSSTSYRRGRYIALPQHTLRGRTPPSPEVVQYAEHSALPVRGCDLPRLWIKEAFSTRLWGRVPQPNCALPKPSKKPNNPKGTRICQSVPGPKVGMRAPTMVLAWSTRGEHISRDGNFPPASTRARANIDIVEVHEESVVKALNILKRRAPPHHERSVYRPTRPDVIGHDAIGEAMTHTDTSVPDKTGRIGCTIGPTENRSYDADIDAITHQSVELLHGARRNADIVSQEEHEVRPAPQSQIDACIHPADVPNVGTKLYNAYVIGWLQVERLARATRVMYDHDITLSRDRLRLKMIEKTGYLGARPVRQYHNDEFGATLATFPASRSPHDSTGRINIHIHMVQHPII